MTVLVKPHVNVVHLLTSMESGGAQEVLKSLASYVPSTYKHTVFYMNGGNAYRCSGDALALASALEIDGFCSLMRAVGYLTRFLKQTPSPVCLQGWMYQGNLLALLVKLVSPRTPVILSIHNGSDRREFTSLSGFLASRICGLFSGMAKATIFVSTKSLACHVSYKKSIVIPNPIKPLKMVNEEVEARSDSVMPVVTLACVVRFDPIKNIGFMLDVIQGIRSRGLPIRLLMAGGGMSAENSMLMGMLQTRNLENNVELLGVVSNISSVYARADYTILTSKCESFSNVLLESIACGTPFIASDVGIASDLVSPESSVIQGYDVLHWVDRLEQILCIRKTASISQSVRNYYERVGETYAPERIAQLYADCWAKAIGQ